MDCTPSALSEASKCLRCLSPGTVDPSRIYLLCQWANKPTCDPDALAFIAAAGITDPTQITAVCKLVLDLKTTGAPTSFWDRDIIIYPFVGGTAARHALNLKDRTGTYDLVYTNVAAMTHNQFGAQGDGATAYATTNFTEVIGMRDDLRIMWYTQIAGTVDGRVPFGTNRTIGGLATGVFSRPAPSASQPWDFAMNDFANTANAWGGASVFLGASFVQRVNFGVNKKWMAIASSLGWTTKNVASTGVPDRPMFLWAYNNDGAGVGNFSNIMMSGWSLGSGLTTDAEMLAYKAIWDTYENTLGRGHPLGV